MSATKAVINLGKNFNERPTIGLDVRGRYMVGLDRVNAKDGCILSSFCGYGETVEQAASDFLDKCRGKLLVKDVEYGEKKRIEFVCV